MANQIKLGNMNCGGRFLKFLLFFLNVIFFVGGIIIAGIAGYVSFEKDNKVQKLLEPYRSPFFYEGLYVLLAVGVLLIVVSLIGLWGALAENTCLLFSYLLILFIVLVLQIAGVIVSFVEFKNIETKAIADLKKPPLDLNDTAPITQDLQVFEEEFHCCGISGPQDYGQNALPPACYERNLTAFDSDEMDRSSDHQTTASMSVVYSKGCLTIAKPYLDAAGGTAIAIIFMELLALIMTCCFMSVIRDQYEPVK